MEKVEPIIIKKEVDIIISVQAVKVISSSKYKIEEFIEWILKDQKIPIGGNNATIFLEHMYNKERR